MAVKHGRSAVGVKGKLDALKKAWKGAQERVKKNPAGYGDDFPFEDGIYIFRLVEMEIRESQAGNLGCQSKYVCMTEGDAHGQVKTSWHKLEDEDSLERFVRDLRRLEIEGIEDAGVEELEDAAVAVTKEKPVVRARLVTPSGSDRQFINVQKVLDPNDLPPDASDPEEKEEEKEKPTKKGKKKDDEETLELCFDPDDLSKKERKALVALAEKSEIDPDEHAEIVDLIQAIAEHHGLVGKFDDIDEFMEGIEESQGKKKKDEDEDEDEKKDKKKKDEDEDEKKDAGEEREPVVGDAVEFTPEGSKKEIEGVVKSVDRKSKTVVIKVGMVKHKDIDWDDLTLLVD